MARPVSEMHTSTICCHQLRRRSEDLRGRRMKGRTVIIGAEERRRGKNEEKADAEAERERVVKMRRYENMQIVLKIEYIPEAVSIAKLSHKTACSANIDFNLS